MAEWRGLESWLTHPVADARPLAHDAGGALAEPAFRLRIAGWMQALQDRAAGAYALHLADPFDFAAALFALWQLDLSAVLPADLHADNLRCLRGEVAGWIVDDPIEPCVQWRPALAEPAWRALDPASLGLRLFTSGSTGLPQPIDKSIGQLAREIEALQSAFGADLGGMAVAATVSHQHIYGLLFRVLWPLCAGRSIGRERLAFPEQIAAALAQQASVLVSTPAHLARLPELPQWAQAGQHPHRLFSSGGALEPAAARRVRECLGQPVHEIYGSSETGGIAWRRHAVDPSPWQPLPGVQLRIEGERLRIRSPFLPDPAHWHACADRVAAEGEGFRLLGRDDRIVKIEERRVSLTAIERALAALDGVQAAHVLLLEGRRRMLGAVLELADEVAVPDHPAARRAWVQRARMALAEVVDAVCWPRQWRFSQGLQRDARGKLPEAALRRLFAAELPAPMWIERDTERAHLRCELLPSLQAFAGHFPAAAVLPGVAMLDWIARWAADAFELAGEFAGMEQLKFQRIARPGMRLEFELHCREQGRRVEFRVSSAAGQHASGRLRFVREPACA